MTFPIHVVGTWTALLVCFGRTSGIGCTASNGRTGDAARAETLAPSAALGRGPTTVDTGVVPSYAGTDAHGVPRYARRAFSADERALLRRVYGIEDPHRLYVADSTPDGVLKYDTQVKRCRSCLVNSYRVGFVSVRRPGESWEQLERRVRATPLRAFPPRARRAEISTAALDTDIRRDVDRMLGDARRAGFAMRVTATYRTPEREAYLMAERRGRTHTLTSLHSYGRAVDVVVGDGNVRHAATHARWVAFRRWVARYRGGEFRLLGTPDRTWDWGHVEVPSSTIGFHTIEAALSRARACIARTTEPAPAHHGDRRSAPLARNRAARTTTPCDFVPHLAAAKG